MMAAHVLLACLAAVTATRVAGCPFMNSGSGTVLPSDRKLLTSEVQGDDAAPCDEPVPWPVPGAGYNPDLSAIKADIKEMFKKSHAWWPADNGHYGPLMIRLAWHCAGSYRYSDGRGGCDGANIRYLPEYGWGDNTNLDKALRILSPVKLKHPEITWGDFIVLVGNTAYEDMGFPEDKIPFCLGRIDSADGRQSLVLSGPLQQKVTPCQEDGKCAWPLGPTHVGNIYVNPGGPMGNGVPRDSAKDIREVFSRMGMNDVETVALIGAGHAVGRCHGACDKGAGPGPSETLYNPWPGMCGQGDSKGKGINTFGSGYEGQWTVTPTQWSNLFFKYLLDFDWEEKDIPTGLPMWKPVKKEGGTEEAPDVAFLTSDLALIHDPQYKAIVQTFYDSIEVLEDAFASAWYKLTTGDMGPVERCTNSPPAHPFQDPLPAPTSGTPTPGKLRSIRHKIIEAVQHELPSVEGDVDGDGDTYYGALLATYAYNCAATYRATDHRGGCNGGRIRHEPQSEWPINRHLTSLLDILEPIHTEYKDDISFADLIVYAGTVATEEALGISIPGLCFGRSDSTEDSAHTEVDLSPRTYYTDAIIASEDNMAIMGLSATEYVALQARLRSPRLQEALGYSGSYTHDPSEQTKAYYSLVLQEGWRPVNASKPAMDLDAEFVMGAGEDAVYMTSFDLALQYIPGFRAVAQAYASDEQAFLDTFKHAWAKLMNAGLWDGPLPRTCD